MPSQVVAISGWMPPWFQANVLVGGVVGTVMHGELQFAAPREQEVVGLREHRQRRRPLRVGRDHVQRLHSDRVGEGCGDVLGVTRCRG